VLEGMSTNVIGMDVPTMTLKEGYWRTSQFSKEILPCLNPDHCVGGSDPTSYCSDGYEGPLCAVCSSGYAAVGSGETLMCNQCTGSQTATVVVGILIIISLLIAAFLYFFKNSIPAVKRRFESFDSTISSSSTFQKIKELGKYQPIFKIVFAYFQVVGGLGFVFSIK
jgi:hypothetical protein